MKKTLSVILCFAMLITACLPVIAIELDSAESVADMTETESGASLQAIEIGSNLWENGDFEDFTAGALDTTTTFQVSSAFGGTYNIIEEDGNKFLRFTIGTNRDERLTNNGFKPIEDTNDTGTYILKFKARTAAGATAAVSVSSNGYGPWGGNAIMSNQTVTGDTWQTLSGIVAKGGNARFVSFYLPQGTYVDIDDIEFYKYYPDNWMDGGFDTFTISTVGSENIPANTEYHWVKNPNDWQTKMVLTEEGNKYLKLGQSNEMFYRTNYALNLDANTNYVLKFKSKQNDEGGTEKWEIALSNKDSIDYVGSGDTQNNNIEPLSVNVIQPGDDWAEYTVNVPASSIQAQGYNKYIYFAGQKLCLDDISLEEAPIQPDPVKHSSSYKENVHLNYYFAIGGSVDVATEVTVDFATASKTIATGVVSTRNTVIEGKTYYAFTCPILPAELDTEVTATLKLNDVGMVTDTYSFAQYAEAINASGASTEEKALVAATISYGNAVKAYLATLGA